MNDVQEVEPPLVLRSPLPAAGVDVRGLAGAGERRPSDRGRGARSGSDTGRWLRLATVPDLRAGGSWDTGTFAIESKGSLPDDALSLSLPAHA